MSQIHPGLPKRPAICVKNPVSCPSLASGSTAPSTSQMASFACSPDKVTMQSPDCSVGQLQIEQSESCNSHNLDENASFELRNASFSNEKPECNCNEDASGIPSLTYQKKALEFSKSLKANLIQGKQIMEPSPSIEL